MSDIIRVSKNGAVTVTMRSIGDAIHAGRIESLLGDIKKLITRAVAYRGQTTTDKDLNAIAGFYLQDLQDEFCWLDMKEIEQIFRLGVRGKLGEYYGINAGTLYDWTTEYCKSHRADYIRQRNEKPILCLEQKKAISPEESDRIVIEGINRHYHDYCASVANPSSLKDENTPSGNIVSILEKNAEFGPLLSQMKKRYQAGHPLFDPGDHQIKWLHAHGYAGTLKEIFDAALVAGKEDAI